ncbi:hypothetical protein CY34DRAFT_696887 [Suillus luteus UH-Slu-Lm8-n1]|uniref:Uncharacterized protein n=1 Tax=Suillus luteus UH-Slu-Lm8-n1 TaxID=930992 RepID=A0A0D0A5T6_9AGAM|nr:hypothetical protein CY34DRAFT_696887 [Suillus luteus UH-Slu-Lm8-n1]
MHTCCSDIGKLVHDVCVNGQETRPKLPVLTKPDTDTISSHFLSSPEAESRSRLLENLSRHQDCLVCRITNRHCILAKRLKELPMSMTAKITCISTSRRHTFKCSINTSAVVTNSLALCHALQRWF